METMALLRRIAKAVSLTGLLLLSQTAIALAQGLQNPLSSQFSTIPGFISGALKVLVQVSLPIITIFIVYAGFKFVTARGNPGKLSEARTNFMYVILGALLILGAWILATLIGGTVSQLLG